MTIVGNPQLTTLRLPSTHHLWVKWVRSSRSYVIFVKHFHSSHQLSVYSIKLQLLIVFKLRKEFLPNYRDHHFSALLSSKKEITNINQWFWLVTINSLSSLIHGWYCNSNWSEICYGQQTMVEDMITTMSLCPFVLYCLVVYCVFCFHAPCPFFSTLTGDMTFISTCIRNRGKVMHWNATVSSASFYILRGRLSWNFIRVNLI